MALRNSSQSKAKGGEWKGILLMLLLVFISVLNVNVASHSLSFVFLPLIGVCLWPRTENSIVSIIAILIFGLLLDLLSAGPLGLWPLIFLTVFAVSKPHLRPRPHGFTTAYLLWGVVLTLAAIASYFLGWFAVGRRPDIAVLISQAIVGLVLFPLIYSVRYIGNYLLSDPDMRGL